MVTGGCIVRVNFKALPNDIQKWSIMHILRTKNVKNYDYIIVGGGILGLATAWKMKIKQPDSKIILIEKASRTGQHQTGRNSGVIHAGVYYKTGSLKSKLCRAGLFETIQFCEKYNVNFKQCGKLIVATDQAEHYRLDELENKAYQNGLTPSRIGSDELREREPNIAGVSALLVKETGIVDYGQICERLSTLLKNLDVEIKFNTELLKITESTKYVDILTNNGSYQAQSLIACAGLQSDWVAALVGLADDFRIIPFRGEYFRLPSSFNDVSKHLIYPVPDPNYPFLGVHLTKTIGGFVTVGPNAVLSLGRETYDRNRPDKDLWRTLNFIGFWKLLAGNMSATIHEASGSLSKKIYLRRCQKYCPSLQLCDLSPHPTGIRAQAVARNGTLIDDFLIKHSARTIHICNAPSPAATSAFPIADKIVSETILKLN